MSTGASGPQFGERANYGPDDICYRHPDRPSFTLCQRCGKTICSDCQQVSAVGVLCPNCVRDMQPSTMAQARRGSSVSLRKLTASDSPVVTYGIIAVCIIVYIAQMLSVQFGDSEVTKSLWYAPLYSMPTQFEPWRMFTVMFTHSTSSFFHILFNLFTLWLFGRQLEQMMGRLSYALLFIFAGLGGSLAVMFWVYADIQTIVQPTVGASGAIFGVLAATLVAYKAANINVTSLAVLLALNVAIGFMPGSTVSWQAHVGGMLIGGLTMWAVLRTRGPRLKQQRIWAMTAIAFGLILLSGSYFIFTPDLLSLSTFR